MGKVTARIKITNWLDSEMPTMGARKEAIVGQIPLEHLDWVVDC